MKGKVNRKRETTYNFGAGPATLPTSVLEKAREELLNYKGTGMSVVEMSHRGIEFKEILANAKKTFKILYDIPDNYNILFMQGGATTQFSGIPLNLLGDKKKDIDDDIRNTTSPVYVTTGRWSNLAAEEAKKYDNGVQIITSESSIIPKYTVLNSLPSKWEQLSSSFSSFNPSYYYYCENETIDGVEIPSGFIVDTLPRDMECPIVADVSSNFCSRPINVSDYGVIYGGAQKNVGIAGVTIMIIRDDLLHLPKPDYMPKALNWELMAAADSCLNTPPVFSIYMAGLCFDWLLNTRGGLEKIAEDNYRKSQKLYKCLEESSFYVPLVEDIKFRSRMNVPFRIKKCTIDSDSTDSSGDDIKYNTELEEEFVSKANDNDLLQLKGHRSLGGLRASLYNAMSEEGVDKLIEFMKEFEEEHI